MRALQRTAARRAFAMGVLLSCLCAAAAMFTLRASGQVRSPQDLARDADAAYVRGDVQQAIRLYEELLKIAA